MSKLVNDAEDGGAVAQSLLSLQDQVGKINPNHVDFTMGTFRRWLSKIPGVGTPVSQWFAKFQNVDGVIQDIVSNLKQGQKELKRENVTLTEDKKRMRSLIFKLHDYISLGSMMDKKLSEYAENEQDTDKKSFVEEEILFPLRQCIMDRQQLLAVNQQGVFKVFCRWRCLSAIIMS